jgi:hypothetical protein
MADGSDSIPLTMYSSTLELISIIWKRHTHQNNYSDVRKYIDGALRENLGHYHVYGIFK